MIYYFKKKINGCLNGIDNFLFCRGDIILKEYLLWKIFEKKVRCNFKNYRRI